LDIGSLFILPFHLQTGFEDITRIATTKKAATGLLWTQTDERLTDFEVMWVSDSPSSTSFPSLLPGWSRPMSLAALLRDAGEEIQRELGVRIQDAC
jgi:hypothetical protein